MSAVCQRSVSLFVKLDRDALVVVHELHSQGIFRDFFDVIGFDFSGDVLEGDVVFVGVFLPVTRVGFGAGGAGEYIFADQIKIEFFAGLHVQFELGESADIGAVGFDFDRFPVANQLVSERFVFFAGSEREGDEGGQDENSLFHG